MRKINNGFDEIHNAFKPIHAVESVINDCGYIGKLPNSFKFFGDNELIVNEEHLKRLEYVYGVRETGPDAWSASLTVRKNTLFRWNPSKKYGRGGWYLTTADNSISVGSAGCELETIEFRKKNGEETLIWVLHKFEAM